MPKAIQDEIKREPTSINADPEKWKRAKIEAINRGTTLTELFETALEKELSGGACMPKALMEYLEASSEADIDWKMEIVKGKKVVIATKSETTTQSAEDLIAEEKSLRKKAKKNA